MLHPEEGSSSTLVIEKSHSCHTMIHLPSSLLTILLHPSVIASSPASSSAVTLFRLPMSHLLSSDRLPGHHQQCPILLDLVVYIAQQRGRTDVEPVAVLNPSYRHTGAAILARRAARRFQDQHSQSPEQSSESSQGANTSCERATLDQDFLEPSIRLDISKDRNYLEEVGG